MTKTNENEYLAPTQFVPPENSIKGWVVYGRDYIRQNPKWIMIVALLLIMGGVFWLARTHLISSLAILSDQEVVSDYIQSFGLFSPVILGLSQYLQVIIAFIPGHVFVLAGGYVYGFLPGLALNMLFVVTASQLAFFLAKKAGRPLVGKLVDAQTLDKWEGIANKRGITFFTIAFVLPVFPTDAMNFVAGLSGMDGRKFLIANFFGRLPGVAAITYVGAYGIEFSNTAWAVLVVVVVLVYVLGRYTIFQIEQQHTAQQTVEKTPTLVEPSEDQV